ncbi:MAG: TonB-dependent receptor [Pseudomonadota bacterium]
MTIRIAPTAALGALLACVLQPALASEAQGDDIIEEVIVIGSKTSASRQELGTSVGYIGPERIEAEAIYNVEDVFDRTANAFTGTAGFGAYSIRGVNNNGITGSFNNSNALASIVVNGVALGVNSGDYVVPSLFDAASAEVLRGPQSSLQGPNSLIGAVYLNYARPEFDNSRGKVRVEGGELDTLRISAAQNIELVDDIFAARIAFDKRESEGDAVNTVTGADDVRRIDEETLRLGLRLQPMGDDQLTVDFTWFRNESDSNPFGLLVSSPGGDLFDREQPFNTEDDYPSDFDLFSLEVGWQLSDNWRFTSITGASDFRLDQGFDGDLTPFDFLAVDGFIEEDLFSQELRLNYEGDQLSALVGLFYSDGEYGSGFSGTGFFPDGMGGIAPFNTLTDNVETIEQQALYGQLIWRFADRFQLTVGARLNREERTTENFTDNNGLVSDLDESESFDQFIPMVELAWEASDTTSVGVKYARGFQAGGIAFAVFLAQANAYDEEFTDNYEVFVRHRSADGRFTLNANAFYIDWTDQQVVATLPGGFPGFDDEVLNAGESTVRGIEVETEWFPTPNFSLFGSLGVTDAEFDNFIFNGVDLAGTPFPQAPDFNASVGARYDSGRGWFGAATFSYVDETFTDIQDPDGTAVNARNLLSGRVGYGGERWRAYLWGTNLLDDEYELGLFNGATFGIPEAYGRVGAPRTVGLGVQVNW